MNRGQFTGELVGVIMGIAFLVIAIVVYSQFSGSSSGKLTSDETLPIFESVEYESCKSRILSMTRESIDTSEDYNQITNFLNINLLEFGAKCKTNQHIINLQDISSCPQEVKSMTLNILQTYENCAIYEMLELARACWEMNGIGTIDGYNWACFNAVISNTENTDSKLKLTTRVNSIFQCDGENAMANCKLNKAEALPYAKAISVYEAYLGTLKEVVKTRLYGCTKIDAQYNGVNLTFVSDDTGIMIMNEHLYDTWHNDLVYSFEENNQLNTNLINPYINYSTESDKECEKYKFDEELEILLINITDARTEQAPYILNFVGKYCSSRKNNENCDLENIEWDLNTELSEGLATHITWNEIEEVMSNAIVSETGLSYEDYFQNNFALRNREPIREGSTFQIVYCDGILDVWGGLIPSYACMDPFNPDAEAKKILISNKLDAGGARLAGENIAASCPFFETVDWLVGTSSTNKMVEICEYSSII